MTVASVVVLRHPRNISLDSSNLVSIFPSLREYWRKHFLRCHTLPKAGWVSVVLFLMWWACPLLPSVVKIANVFPWLVNTFSFQPGSFAPRNLGTMCKIIQFLRLISKTISKCFAPVLLLLKAHGT